MEAAGLRFALTSEGAEKDFWKNLRKAVSCGLSKEQALRSLTEVPAGLIGMEAQLGTLEEGKLANFIITSSELFDEDNVIYENWVRGNRYQVNDLDFPDIRGVYELQVNGVPEMEMTVSGSPVDPEIQIKAGSEEAKGVFSRTGDLFSLLVNLEEAAGGTLRLNGLIAGHNSSGNAPSGQGPLKLEGQATLPGGETAAWSAMRTGDAEDAKAEKEKDETGPRSPGAVIYPFLAYGREEPPRQEKVLIRNATVWTNEAEGILENADVLVANGKIAAVGQGLNAGGAKVIDAGGKHLTPGIVDEHSHIAATRGINEAGQAVSSEVRIGDVINSEDIDIYRQLAGGVTTSHILHGSANPIGGQTQLIKLRWGMGPEALKFEGADGFIKFALGENVKQSNWGDNQTTRFPQTRMGVEQVMMDASQRAREYEKARADGGNVRRDLELDALVEILNDERFITCHSYVQSEIAMLMQVADSMDFRVNTFTHILEGYKVADKMKAHGAAGSTFSDWWAYKMEVKDAIPYNAAIMHKMGILTGINSDDAEMARRLNQEAAKAVKYGGLSEEEALKLVTLNPAKMLHIDDRVGSIKAGKDADLVIWTENPLSIYARVEKTFVDGIAYYDAAQDSLMRQEVRKERVRLTREMLNVKHNGGKTRKPAPEKKVYYHCEDVFDEFKD
ncbi:amidohydrolase [Anseongella ginsenosidimutans]|uniref:amidohydrolase n=1 Tax=Anseongella ginsenosidimutans TaxID=496056 RepID=UPI001CEF57E9|nr:amidohydrolase [Anseongella ginsenosidimutans]